MLKNVQVYNFILACLTDEHGISEKAAQVLHDIVNRNPTPTIISKMVKRIEMRNGRYYLMK